MAPDLETNVRLGWEVDEAGRGHIRAMLVGVALALAVSGPATGEDLLPVAVQELQGWALVERLRRGGFVLYFRHADTTGMPCDRSHRIGTARARETSRR